MLMCITRTTIWEAPCKLKEKKAKPKMKPWRAQKQIAKTRPIFQPWMHTLAVLATSMEVFVVDKLSMALKRPQDWDACSFQSIALQMQHQGILGKLCSLGLQGSNAQMKTVESLFSLDLLQRMPEFHQLHQSYSGCTCAELPQSMGLTQIPKSLRALHHTIKTEVAWKQAAQGIQIRT